MEKENSHFSIYFLVKCSLLESKVKYLVEKCVVFRRLRDDLIKLRVEFKSAEERHRYYLKVHEIGETSVEHN